MCIISTLLILRMSGSLYILEIYRAQKLYPTCAVAVRSTNHVMNIFYFVLYPMIGSNDPSFTMKKTLMDHHFFFKLVLGFLEKMLPGPRV